MKISRGDKAFMVAIAASLAVMGGDYVSYELGHSKGVQTGSDIGYEDGIRECEDDGYYITHDIYPLGKTAVTSISMLSAHDRNETLNTKEVRLSLNNSRINEILKVLKSSNAPAQVTVAPVAEPHTRPSAKSDAEVAVVQDFLSSQTYDSTQFDINIAGEPYTGTDLPKAKVVIDVGYLTCGFTLNYPRQ